MQEYQIALSPDLELTPVDFAAAWNEESETHSIAKAHVVPSTGTHYDPTLIAGAVISITTGLASNALYDLIKQVFVKYGVHKRTKFTQLDQPDGTHLLVIEIEEGKERQSHGTDTHPGAPRQTKRHQRRSQFRSWRRVSYYHQ